jgi:SAM-dependent methyltransferase
MNIIGNLEYPISNQIINSNAMIIQGNCFAEPSSDLTLEISIDDIHVQNAAWGLPRFDIFQKYSTEDAYESGFVSRIPLSNFDDGEHELKITVKNKKSEQIFSKITFKKNLKYDLKPIPVLPTGDDSNFKKFGNEMLQKFMDFGNLTSKSVVLDIGCGMGRMALPLTKFLKEGEYCGLDIIPFVIDYLTKNISTRFSNFNFIRIDTHNQLYNINPSIQTNSFIFPLPDNQFDFIFLISVFTHMLPEDLINYLKEIHRILKTGGRCFITFFVANKEKLKDDHFTSNFQFNKKNYRLKNNELPEAAISFEENYLREIFLNLKFKIIEPIHFARLPDQDFIILEK